MGTGRWLPVINHHQCTSSVNRSSVIIHFFLYGNYRCLGHNFISWANVYGLSLISQRYYGPLQFPCRNLIWFHTEVLGHPCLFCNENVWGMPKLRMEIVWFLKRDKISRQPLLSVCDPKGSVVVKTSSAKTKTNTKNSKWDIKQIFIDVSRTGIKFLSTL